MRPKNLEKEQAIRTVALQMIADDGLENLGMQKLAKAANISPRTIYIKYKDKEDFLIRLFIDEVLGHYEKAVLENFDPDMEFSKGMQRLWLNTFRYLKNNYPHFALMQYGRSSPMLNKAFQEHNIKEGDYFAPILLLLDKNTKNNVIKKFPHDIQKALLFTPLHELVKEYFDHQHRRKQIVTEKVITECCEVVIQGILKQK